MTRDDIIRLALEAEFYSNHPRTPGTGNMIERRLERFAALVAAAEREAILEHCEAMRRAHTGYQAPSGLMQLIDTIRARGESK